MLMKRTTVTAAFFKVKNAKLSEIHLLSWDDFPFKLHFKSTIFLIMQ